MPLFEYLKNIGLLILLATGRSLSAASTVSSNGGDFSRGSTLPAPYQPCAGFELVAGRANTQTMLWILGDVHNRETKQPHTLTVQCIEKLTKDIENHEIYLEGVKAGQKVSCEKHGIKDKAGRTCKGWDDPAAWQGLVNSLANKLLTAPIAGLQTLKKDKQLTDIQFDGLLQKVLSTTSIGEEMRQASTWLLDQRKGGASYKKIFAKANAGSADGLQSGVSADIAESSLRRMESLVKTVKNHPEDRFGIVVTGRAHVVKRESGDIGAAEYVRQELARGENGNPYAVLAIHN